MDVDQVFPQAQLVEYAAQRLAGFIGRDKHTELDYIRDCVLTNIGVEWCNRLGLGMFPGVELSKRESSLLLKTLKERADEAITVAMRTDRRWLAHVAAAEAARVAQLAVDANAEHEEYSQAGDWAYWGAFDAALKSAAGSPLHRPELASTTQIGSPDHLPAAGFTTIGLGHVPGHCD